MKKSIALVFVLIAISTSVIAQVTFEIRVGGNFQNINGNVATGELSKNKVIPCFNAGAFVNLPVGIDFAVQTGLQYSQKGAKITDQFQNAERIQTTHLNYLELPVNFVFSPIVGNGNLLLGFGPYFSYALSGAVVNNQTNVKTKILFQNEVKIGETGTAYYKPLDMGANFFFGFEIRKHLQIQFNAQLGAIAIQPKDERITNDKTLKKNTGFGVSLGWKF
jgi:hypothetical protein